MDSHVPLAFVWMSASAVCGVIVFALALNGYPSRTFLERVVLLVAAYFLIDPVLWRDFVGLGIAAVLLGVRFAAQRRHGLEQRIP